VKRAKRAERAKQQSKRSGRSEWSEWTGGSCESKTSRTGARKDVDDQSGHQDETAFWLQRTESVTIAIPVSDLRKLISGILSRRYTLLSRIPAFGSLLRFLRSSVATLSSVLRCYAFFGPSVLRSKMASSGTISEIRMRYFSEYPEIPPLHELGAPEFLARLAESFRAGDVSVLNEMAEYPGFEPFWLNMSLRHFCRHSVGDGSNLLSVAAEYGHTHLVSRLIDLGADVNLAHQVENPPLCSAAHDSRLDVLQMFLTRGVDVNQCGAWSRASALDIAASGGHVQACRLLLEAGASQNDYIPGSGTALDLAMGNGHLDCVAVILEFPRIPSAFERDRRFFHYIRYDHPEYLRGEGLSRQDSNGNTLLHLLAVSGRRFLLRHFLRQGPDLSILNNRGQGVRDVAASRLQTRSAGMDDGEFWRFYFSLRH